MEFKLLVQIGHLGRRVFHCRFNLLEKEPMRSVLVEKFHGLLKLGHKDLRRHLKAGQEHDDLAVEVGHAVSSATNDSKVVLGALELAH